MTQSDQRPPAPPMPTLSPSRPRWFPAPRDRTSAALWLVLSAAMAATLYSTHFLPFYDYYQWLFQGHVVSVLLFGADTASGGVSSLYFLSAVPVPNLAAPIAIGLLDTFLPTETAGRLFVVVTVLAFAVSFGYLVRAIQRRPTAIEYTGFLWAPGFFLYKGYLSYLFGLALAFVLIGLLHRAVVTRASSLSRTTLWCLCGLGALLYLSHLLAWVIGVLAVLVHALVLARRGCRAQAGLLLLTILPGVVMAIWYVLAERGGNGITLYDSWLNKAISLTETLQFFLRLDPFPPMFPIFWSNLLLGLAFVALVVRHVDRTALRAAVATRPVLWLSGLLGGIALLLPVSMLNDLIKPDERFVLPALLLTVAALPYRAFRLRARAAAAALVAIVLGLHVVEYSAVGQRIGQVDAATDTFIPAGAPILQLAIPSRNGCAPSSGPSIGVPMLKWFGVDYVLETGQAQVNIDETSFVHARDPAHPGLMVLAPAVSEVPAAVLPAAPIYPYVQAVACPSDLSTIEQSLTPVYRPVARGEGYTIFRRTR
ncbi:MAG: hypothetical protein JWR58_437 [Pseudonocardia sp.]|nr:hypothetical protein [Pseudonocardia sp.]